MKKIFLVISLYFSVIIIAILSIFLIPNKDIVHLNATSLLSDFEIQVLIDTTIAEIEYNLASKKTDVVTELNSQLNYYENMLLTKTDNEERIKIQNLINTTQDLIYEYEMHTERKIQNSIGIQPFGSFHIYYSPVIASFISAFWSEKWYLAAELLTHNMNNNAIGSRYTPTNWKILENSTILNQKAQEIDIDVVGDIEFKDPGTWYGYIPFLSRIADQDAHYAINKATYRKTYFYSYYVNIAIKDLYDWDEDDGIFFEAQNAGVLTPFYTVIPSIIVEGSVPFDHEFQNGEAVITGAGHTTTAVNIPSTIKNFWEDDLDNDNKMSDLNVRIGSSAFLGKTELQSVTIADGVLSIESSAFSVCTSLVSLTLPNSVTSIGNSAFSYCSNLESINIPYAVTRIGDFAFLACNSLTSIYIPSSVMNIGNNSFGYCASLSSIVVSDDNFNYASQDGILYNKTKTAVVYIPLGKNTIDLTFVV